LQTWRDGYGDVDAVALARDESTGTWSGLSVDYFHSRIAVGPWYFADFTPVTVGDPFQFDKAVKLGETNMSPYYTVPPPSVAAGGGTFFALVEELGGPVRDGLTWEVVPYELTPGGRAEVRWDGGGYLVAGSRDVARFTPEKALRSTQSLGAEVEQSSVVPDAGGAVALVQRGLVPFRALGTIEQIEAFRVTFPE
jgi:hypothetical protein